MHYVCVHAPMTGTCILTYSDTLLMQVTLSSLLEVQPNQVTLSQVKVQERRGQTQSSVIVLSSAKVSIINYT